MMVIKKQQILLWMVTVLSPCVTFSTPDLLQIMESSLNYDPTYLSTAQTNRSTMAAVGISRAALLPQLSGTVSKNWNWSKDTTGNSFTTSANKARGIGLSLTQSIFNFSNFKTLAAAQVSALAAKLDTMSAYQTLIQTVASAYFNVASAQAVLEIDEEQVKVNQELLRLSQAQYHAGQILASDVLTAEASLLSSKQTVMNQKQTLIGYQNTLHEHIPLLPNQIRGIVGDLVLKKLKREQLSRWLKKGLMINPGLIEKKLDALAAKKRLQSVKAELLPSLSASYSYSGSNTLYTGATTVVIPASQSRSNAFGVTMSIPLYQGGETYATIKQDTYSYMAAKDTYREQQKTVESGVSTNFQSMGLEIDVINNLKKSVEVYHQNYEAMLQAYTLGKETMTDVQNALTTYYSQKSTLVQAEYSFLTSYVTFKQQVGDLSMKDITEINNWMHKHVQS
jgi:outer membrane protein